MVTRSNLILIGYRGAGKSFIAKKLAKQLNIQLFSSDELIEKKLNTTIKEFVQNNGWDKFKKIEREVLKENLNLQYNLIDLGGGAIMHTDIMEEFKKNSIFCFIDVSIDNLAKRLKEDSHRPVIKNNLSLKDEIKHTLALRRPLYQKYSDVTVENNGNINSFSNFIGEIVEKYKKLI